MKPLITIKGQQFYSADISKLIAFSTDNKCAVIISENYLKELFSAKVDYSANTISQVIIVSDSLNSHLQNFIGKSVFVISAVSAEQAIEIAFQSDELNESVVCVMDQNENELKEVIESVVV